MCVLGSEETVRCDGFINGWNTENNRLWWWVVIDCSCSNQHQQQRRRTDVTQDTHHRLRHLFLLVDAVYHSSRRRVQRLLRLRVRHFADVPLQLDRSVPHRSRNYRLSSLSRRRLTMLVDAQSTLRILYRTHVLRLQQLCLQIHQLLEAQVFINSSICLSIETSKKESS